MNKSGKFYGSISARRLESDTERVIEEVTLRGVAVLEGVVDQGEIGRLRAEVLRQHEIQVSRYGLDFLESRGERDVVRAPLLESDAFLTLAVNPFVTEIIRRLIGTATKLHLQNAIVNRQSIEHHQSSWHRDIPYADYTVSRPIAVSVLIALDAFSESTGGTEFLVGSHLYPDFPSLAYAEAHRRTVTAPAGSAIIFNSLVFHRAGFNSSIDFRIGVNHVYTVPYIDRQINLRFGDRLDSFTNCDRDLLEGYGSAESVDAFIRSRRMSSK